MKGALVTLLALVAVGCGGAAPSSSPTVQVTVHDRPWVDSGYMRLGATFDEVTRQIEITRDANGHTQGADLAAQGHTDWYSTGGASIRSASGQYYSPIHYFTFDSTRRLVGASIEWSSFFAGEMDTQRDTLLTFAAQESIHVIENDFTLQDGVLTAARAEIPEQFVIAPSDDGSFTVSYAMGLHTSKAPPN